MTRQRSLRERTRLCFGDYLVEWFRLNPSTEDESSVCSRFCRVRFRLRSYGFRARLYVRKVTMS